MVTTKIEPKEEKVPKVFETVDALKFLYSLLNTVGGPNQMATIPAEMFDKMPPDWMNRMAFKELEVAGKTMYQAYLKPRKRKRNKIVQPKTKKLYLPPQFGS